MAIGVNLPDLGSLLEKQKSGIEKTVESALKKDGTGVVAGLAGVLVSVASGIPALGGITAAIASKAFAVRANEILEGQIAEWEQEKKGRELVGLVTSAVESLVYDALATSMRSQSASADALEGAISDSLIQLTKGQNWWGQRMDRRFDEIVALLRGQVPDVGHVTAVSFRMAPPGSMGRRSANRGA